MKKFSKINILISFISIFLLFVFTFKVVDAASLSFSPIKNITSINTEFKVDVNVSSPDQSINAVSGSISFPTDKLEVVSISNNDSIINYWLEKPVYLNDKGSIGFQGIIFNPSFKGESSNIITITFKTKKIGNPSLSFSSVSILANDGKGTEVSSVAK